MTQEALARKAHVSLGYIARLETDRHDPKLSSLRKIAAALGVPVTELLERTSPAHEARTFAGVATSGWRTSRRSGTGGPFAA